MANSILSSVHSTFSSSSPPSSDNQFVSTTSNLYPGLDDHRMGTCVINGNTGGRPAVVTFAKPIVSRVLEFDSNARSNRQPPHNFAYTSPSPTKGNAANSALSPILAGHPNYINNELNNSPAMCRICYSGEESGPREGEPLISPCNCKGTMGLYHRTCLNHWLVVSQKTRCEICQFKFQLKKTSPSFCAYLCTGNSRSILGVSIRFRANLFTDLLCFLLLTPLVFLSASVCFFSGWHLLSNANLHGPRVEIGIGLFCLSTLLVIAYFIWLGVTYFFHHKAFRLWQSRNWIYTIVDQLSMEESMLVNGGDSGGRIRGRRN